MSFNVNVDYPDRKATIHTVNSSSKCRPRPDKLPKNGYWAGPFATREEAIQVARDSRQQVHLCEECDP